MIKIPMSLTRDYVPHWSTEDAIRENLQNCLDIEDWEVTYEGGMTISSYGATISSKDLLLGKSGKRNAENKRGKFGDGLLVSLLVLTRNGYDVTIETGGEIWHPTIEYSADYDEEILYITIEDNPCGFSNSVVINIPDLDSEIIDNVKFNTLQLQKYESWKGSKGEIIFGEEHRGRVYVGGLFVDEFKTDYGFNFEPQYFPLDRDRKSLNPFDVQWQCKSLWEEYSRQDSDDAADAVLTAIERKDDSIYYASVSCTQSLKNKAESIYKDKYSDKLVTSDYTEFKELQDAGNEVELVQNDKLVSIIHQTEAYKTFKLNANVVEKKSVSDLLYEFKEKYSSDMPTDMYYDFEDMEAAINKLV